MKTYIITVCFYRRHYESTLRVCIIQKILQAQVNISGQSATDNANTLPKFVESRPRIHLATLGGNLGLCTGFSIVVVFEFLQFAFDYILLLIEQRKKKK